MSTAHQRLRLQAVDDGAPAPPLPARATASGDRSRRETVWGGSLGGTVSPGRCHDEADADLEAHRGVPHGVDVVALGNNRSPGTDATRGWQGQGGPSGAGPDREVSGLLAAVDQWDPGPHDPA